MKWISVKDRLPEYGRQVLVWGQHRLHVQMGGAYASICERANFKGTLLEGKESKYLCEHGFRQMAYVTHWMPLPSSPTNEAYEE